VKCEEELENELREALIDLSIVIAVAGDESASDKRFREIAMYWLPLVDSRVRKLYKKYKKTRLYLAHPIGSRRQVRSMELEFEEKTGIVLVNPFYDTNRSDIKLLDDDFVTLEELRAKSGTEIARGDLKLLDRCDGVVGVLIRDNRSIGTICELTYAKMRGMPVYIVALDGAEEHPWVKWLANRIVKSFDDLAEVLKEEVKK